MKFKTPWNSHEFPTKYEVNNLPSETIPDQSMSILEIMQRHAQGLPIDGARVPVFNGEDDDVPDISRMDLAEIEEYKDSVDNWIKETRKKMTQLAKQAKAHQGANVQRTTGDADDQGTDDQPDQPKAAQYPKKTRGAGAEPRDSQSRQKADDDK